MRCQREEWEWQPGWRCTDTAHLQAAASWVAVAARSTLVTPQPVHLVHHGPVADTVLSKRAAVLQLLARKDQP